MATAVADDISHSFAQCQADLIQIDLFFCLRSYKYTETKSHRWTVQFCLKGLQFQDMEGVIPHNAPSNTFLCAWSVTLFLDKKKNSVRGDSTTMEATNLAHGDPVSAAARRFFLLCSHHSYIDTTICSYFLTKGALPKSVTVSHIVSLICLHATRIGFQCLGLYPH